MLEGLLQNRTVALYALTLATMWTWESIAPFFRNPENRLRHDLRNLALGGLNGLVLGIVFAGITTGVAAYVSENAIGLLNLISLPEWLRYAAAFVLLDCWIYTWHRLNHTVPLFWRFHRVHHSDNYMDATSAARFHIGEVSMSMILRLPVIALVGLPMSVIIVYDVTLLVCTLFHHANIALPPGIDRFVRYITVSPFMHKVHHSRIQPETDSNFSSVLSVWDRMFGSYQERENYADIRLGLEGFDGEERQTLPGLLKTPFVPKP